MDEDKRYKASVTDDYILLETWGELRLDDVDEPVDAALALAENAKIDKLLDDIRRVDSKGTSVPVQAKGVEILWKMRKFRKVAIVFSGEEMGWLFLSTLQAVHLNDGGRFKGFRDIDEAVAWIKEA